MSDGMTSLWEATAAPAPETYPLEGDTTADVAVIGGGIAGLSTAIHLARAGRSVTLLEAEDVGWGASGRSGGQVIPGIKYDPDDMIEMFGPEAGAAAIEAFGATAGKVFELIDRYGIDCDDTRQGWVQPAHSEAGLRIAISRCQQWKKYGADVDELTADEVHSRLGADTGFGGWIDRRAGSVQPLSYSRGLARGALTEGVCIASRSPVTDISSRSGKWQLRTASGATVTAPRVAVCTNAYSRKIWPKLERSYIAANSFQVATAPLSSNLDAKIMPGGIVASDTRRLLAYFRKDRDGRLLMGGRGTFGDPTKPEDFAHVERMLIRTFPDVEGYPIEYRWGGRVAITQDSLPHLHEPQPGLVIMVGCQGRGMALQSKMGEWLGSYIDTGRREALPLPLTRIAPIPFHELRRLYVAATIAYFKLRDVVG
ncbi:FAD-binding oxidoreductase [Thioclava sp. F42-5]|uniref:NAD(P)/FAD-dependent oxidoreductase n=1 Tax=Thioclava sp. F42-5 TaxID=1973005 RepID=UPI000B5461F6|nr:FAD-binding oxidoreductase [Thioclava sp. F42-5]